MPQISRHRFVPWTCDTTPRTLGPSTFQNHPLLSISQRRLSVRSYRPLSLNLEHSEVPSNKTRFWRGLRHQVCARTDLEAVRRGYNGRTCPLIDGNHLGGQGLTHEELLSGELAILQAVRTARCKAYGAAQRGHGPRVSSAYCGSPHSTHYKI